MPSDYRRVTVSACESTTRVTRKIILESKIILTSVDHRPRALRTGSRVPNTKTFCLALASNGSSQLSWCAHPHDAIRRGQESRGRVYVAMSSISSFRASPTYVLLPRRGRASRGGATSTSRGDKLGHRARRHQRERDPACRASASRDQPTSAPATTRREALVFAASLLATTPLAALVAGPPPAVAASSRVDTPEARAALRAALEANIVKTKAPRCSAWCSTMPVRSGPPPTTAA